jgi:hypothetical protein
MVFTQPRPGADMEAMAKSWLVVGDGRSHGAEPGFETPDPQKARAALSQIIGDLRFLTEHADTEFDVPGSASGGHEWKIMKSIFPPTLLSVGLSRLSSRVDPGC